MTISWIFVYDGAIKKSNGSQDQSAFRAPARMKSFLKKLYEDKAEIFLLVKSEDVLYKQELPTLLGDSWDKMVRIVTYKQDALKTTVISCVQNLKAEKKIVALVASAKICLDVFSLGCRLIPYENEDNCYLNELGLNEQRFVKEDFVDVTDQMRNLQIATSAVQPAAQPSETKEILEPKAVLQKKYPKLFDKNGQVDFFKDAEENSQVCVCM